MDESLWVVALAGEARLGVLMEETWAILDGPEVRPLPGRKEWCAGLVAFQDNLVPVLGGNGYSRLGRPETLLIVERQGALLGIPCQEVALYRGFLSDNENLEAEPGLPAAGMIKARETQAVWRLDLRRLYSVLGIQ